MNWALDQIWHSPTFPMWLALAAAGFFAVIAVIALLRAERSVANGALTVITLLAVGVALAATARGFGSANSDRSEDAKPSSMPASLPALACVDDLAGEAVLTACEKAVFGSPESTAAALSYAARQITRLTGFGDAVTANKNMTPELEALRRAVEHDRYGLMAEVLVARDHCTASDCAAFKSLTDQSRIAANIDERTYDGIITRYSAIWNMPPAPAAASVAALIPGVPTGKPTNAEFPSAASIPPVSIMTPEPPLASGSRATTPSANAPTPAAPSPKPAPAASPTPAVAAAKKQPAPPPPKPARTPASAPAPAAPTSLAPAASND